MILVHDEYETARRIAEGASLARFGDGELNIAYLERPAFENYDESLAVRLRDILMTQREGLLIGVPDIFSEEAKARLCNPGFWPPYEELLLEKVEGDREFYSNFFSRPDVCCRRPGIETGRKAPKHVDPEYWTLMRSIWEDRHIAVINFNPVLAEHELFHNARQVDFIPCAQRNAWGGGTGYQELLERVLADSRAELHLAVIGPIGTVIAHDLHAAGRWAVDFGQAARIYTEGKGLEHMHLY